MSWQAAWSHTALTAMGGGLEHTVSAVHLPMALLVSQPLPEQTMLGLPLGAAGGQLPVHRCPARVTPVQLSQFAPALKGGAPVQTFEQRPTGFDHMPFRQVLVGRTRPPLPGLH